MQLRKTLLKAFTKKVYFLLNTLSLCLSLSVSLSLNKYSVNTIQNILFSGEHWWKQNIFCLFTTPQAFWQSSAPGALSTLMTVVLHLVTWAILMIPGKDKTYVCRYIRSEFILWALWRILMTTYFLFVHHTTCALAKLSTWCFEHSGDIGCSLVENPSHADESWEGRNTWYIYDVDM